MAYTCKFIVRKSCTDKQVLFDVSEANLCVVRLKFLRDRYSSSLDFFNLKFIVPKIANA